MSRSTRARSSFSEMSRAGTSCRNFLPRNVSTTLRMAASSLGLGTLVAGAAWVVAAAQGRRGMEATRRARSGGASRGGFDQAGVGGEVGFEEVADAGEFGVDRSRVRGLLGDCLRRFGVRVGGAWGPGGACRRWSWRRRNCGPGGGRHRFVGPDGGLDLRQLFAGLVQVKGNKLAQVLRDAVGQFAQALEFDRGLPGGGGGVGAGWPANLSEAGTGEPAAAWAEHRRQPGPARWRRP